ncbi:flavodoxin [Cohaesibacter celericrescens]|uniref:Flavodoxin n=1 Tax=Cohaesibacter celericrescens TaxID=2067669 RepID=A0A2N5XQ83_9HYPH|nr:flavodoxin [Cohaesibacter celericrescens]PLW76597.1 flavodoxin [Cohaesibacter celericrescens]
MKNFRSLNAKVLVSLMALFSLLPAYADDNNSGSRQNKILVAYFSQPEDVSLDGVDAVSGASLLKKNQQIFGATQYIAQLIGDELGTDLYRIEPTRAYPRAHEPLVDLASKEKGDRIRPAIQRPIPDLDQYDTIFVGYPIWWYQMPMILYTFLEENDFSGKKIIPFSTHGGSRLSGTVQAIQSLQPNADVETDAFSISRDDVAKNSTEDILVNWLNDISVE